MRSPYFALFAALLSVACSTEPTAQPTLEITHGPMLGRVGAHQIGVWARTARPGSFLVRYGTSRDQLTTYSGPIETTLDRDNTGWGLVNGLEASTEYFYQIVTSKEAGANPVHSGSFRTLPDPAELQDDDVNPRGDFNFSFEFACGNNQNPAQGLGHGLPTYNQMLANVKDKVDFAVLNGDWLYEEQRDYSPKQWLGQVGAAEDETPRLLQLAPTITGVWENYKLYLSRAPNLSEWHREVPSYYTFDDHELLNDIYGTGTAGYNHRRTVFRDIGVEAWYHYLGWSNPELFTQGIHFGRTSYSAGSDILEDPEADFTAIDLEQAANLHVHWGGPTAAVNDNSLDAEEGDPNAGVYDIVEILDKTKLRVTPSFRADGRQSYSIGRRSYSKMRVSNSNIFFLDTRSHRDMHDVKNPQGPGLSMIGTRQREWLMKEMKESDAEIFFVFSSVNFMIPHVGGTPRPRRLRRRHCQQRRSLDRLSRRPRPSDRLLGFTRQAGLRADRRPAQQLRHQDHRPRLGVRLRPPQLAQPHGELGSRPPRERHLRVARQKERNSLVELHPRRCPGRAEPPARLYGRPGQQRFQ